MYSFPALTLSHQANSSPDCQFWLHSREVSTPRRAWRSRRSYCTSPLCLGWRPFQQPYSIQYGWPLRCDPRNYPHSRIASPQRWPPCRLLHDTSESHPLCCFIVAHLIKHCRLHQKDDNCGHVSHRLLRGQHYWSVLESSCSNKHLLMRMQDRKPSDPRTSHSTGPLKSLSYAAGWRA